jgi:glucose-6-phosphate isomerase
MLSLLIADGLHQNYSKYGKAAPSAQEKSGDDPGRCIAIQAEPGDQVAMPPGWAHYVASLDWNSKLIFGAWCDRQYGFDYVQMRAHHGLAWFPVMSVDGEIRWEANPNYSVSQLQHRKARAYPELGLSSKMPIYEYFRRDPESIQWVSNPGKLSHLWPKFEP